jgi:lactoylglutathione lyase
MERKFLWVTLHVTDLELSLAFYRNLLELEIDRRMKPNPDMEIVFLGKGETKVELISGPEESDIACGNTLSLGFEVPSLDEATDRLSELGIPVYSGPFQPSPQIRFLYVQDPDGLLVQLVEHL